MNPARALARPLLASVFIWDGVDALRHAEEHVAMLEPYDGALNKASEKIPGMPANRKLLVRIGGGVSIAAGLLLATGKAPRLSATALAVLGAQTTVVRYPFWSVKGRERRQMVREFLGRGALTAGAVFAALDRGGQPSAKWRYENWRNQREELQELEDAFVAELDEVKQKAKADRKAARAAS